MAVAPVQVPRHGSTTTPRLRGQDGGGSTSGGQPTRKEKPGARSFARGRSVPPIIACSRRSPRPMSERPIGIYTGKQRSPVRQMGSFLLLELPPPTTPHIAQRASYERKYIKTA